MFNHDGKRTEVIDAGIFAIESVPQGAGTMRDPEVEGVIGLGIDDKDGMNLLETLHTEELIDEKMYAVYVDYVERSSIRFGSYDKGGVADSA